MPGPGSRRGNTENLSVPVRVFQGRLSPTTGRPSSPVPAGAVEVASTTSADDGSYQLDLAPGEYTVVAEIDGLLYLNSFSGAGEWSPVTVSAGAYTRHDICDSSKAAF